MSGYYRMTTKENKQIKNGLFIFHRDLRTQDNNGLLESSRQCEKLYTCFIFTPEQVGKANSFRSQNAIQFMIESLGELMGDLNKQGGELLLFYGNQNAILRSLIQELDIDAIYFNKDYTPYSVKRDQETEDLCKKFSIECQMFADYYLFEPGSIKTGGGSAYKKYTPFYNAAIKKHVPEPTRKQISHLSKTTKNMPNRISLKDAFSHFTKENEGILVHGGRSNGIQRLKLALRDQKQYDKKRDFFIENTTFLSAYIKFGCVSIREVYHTLKPIHGIVRELIWRDFFAHVLYAYPTVVGQSYQEKFRKIKWHHSESDFEKWKKGQTGFPIVDACMRQLNTTGYMHNRGRMTVASFLVKILLMDWRLGEKYFAQKLTDYDIASNNGGWQGISGTGVDMKPYFRDMNPWIQSSNFDNDAEFIKKWVPELKDVDAKDIHKWYDAWTDEKYKNVKYPKPMVDYGEQKQKMLHMYREAE